MPSNVKKPYAMTTMCHLIEMGAMLGLYWKAFDRSEDKHRAEGNGCTLTGTTVASLGLVFTFQITGKPKFRGNRLAPCDEVGGLCFGVVPTIYRHLNDEETPEFLTEEVSNLSVLLLGSRREISGTVGMIGCNANTCNLFLDETKNVKHLFPSRLYTPDSTAVAFETLGMLNCMFHIPNTMFTYIPNPIPERWDKHSVSLIRLLEAYEELVPADLPGVRRNPIIVDVIRRHVVQIVEHHEDENVSPGHRMGLLRILQETIGHCDQVLTARTPQTETDSTEETPKQAKRREVVQDVLRAHIQEVLRFLNEGDDVDPEQGHYNSFQAPWAAYYNYFEDMREAAPEERQHKLMEAYFHLVRPKVVPRAARSTDRRVSIVGVPPGYGFRRAGTGETEEGSADGSEHGSHVSYPEVGSEEDGFPMDRRLSISSGSSAAVTDSEVVSGPLSEQDASHDDVWCTLVFRMIC
ncbi:hypothetical protein ACHAPT_005378 [Fusarium lateritium]